MQIDPVKHIKEIAQPIIEQEDAFLIDVELKHGKILEVWILIDSESGGISVDACSKISREIGFHIDELEIFSGAYRLNVSSPGLSRPLSDRRQYAKNIGRTVKIKYKMDEEYISSEGILKEVNNEKCILLVDKDKQEEVTFDNIVETKVIPRI